MAVKFNKGSFIVVPNKQRLAGLKPTTQIVAVWLADYGTTSWPSATSLAKQCGMSKRSVFNALTELEEAGLVSREARIDENGGQTTNLYTLLVWGEDEVSTPAPSAKSARGGVQNLHGGECKICTQNSPSINSPNINSILESKDSNGDGAPKRTQRSLDIDEAFKLWEEMFVIPISGKREDERRACNTILQRKGVDIDYLKNILLPLVRESDKDKYKRFSITGFRSLNTHYNDLMTWAREKRAQQIEDKKGNVRFISAKVKKYEEE